MCVCIDRGTFNYIGVVSERSEPDLASHCYEAHRIGDDGFRANALLTYGFARPTITATP
jgi:hypothetical protein